MADVLLGMVGREAPATSNGLNFVDVVDLRRSSTLGPVLELLNRDK
jgi:hypothetical protein